MLLEQLGIDFIGGGFGLLEFGIGFRGDVYEEELLVGGGVQVVQHF